MEDNKIKKILLEENYVSAKDIKMAEKESDEKGSSVVEYLVEKNIISKSYNIPNYVTLYYTSLRYWR